MPLTLDQFNGMELLWGNLPKKPDENHITLTRLELEAIWQMGIVDAEKYSLDDWAGAFDDCLRSGTREGAEYVISKEEFLAKEPYRYKGEIKVPFDTLLINEGKYTDEGLKELVDLSIAPSCGLKRAGLDRFIDELKDTYREADGLIRVDMRAKREIKALIEKNPSPLRRLEFIFDALIKEGEVKGLDMAVAPEDVARVEAGAFAIGPSIAQARVAALGGVEKAARKSPPPPFTSAKGGSASGGKVGQGGITLKKIKRSRKGVRG